MSVVRAWDFSGAEEVQARLDATKLQRAQQRAQRRERGRHAGRCSPPPACMSSAGLQGMLPICRIQPAGQSGILQSIISRGGFVMSRAADSAMDALKY